MARVISGDTLALNLSESLAARRPQRTRRDVRLPRVPNKALAVIGEHRRVVPSVLEAGRRTIYLDDIPVVPGWESLVRRVLDAHDTDVFISGSSAKLLSQEVSTSLRGRGMEVLVHPFSFRETLRHAGHEPTEAWSRLGPDERAGIDAALRGYLTVGGFPESQGIDVRDRLPLLKGYVDVMLLRDVIERHRVTNVEALRRLQRHLMANPAGSFAVSKFHRDLRSQGFSVAEETLHLLLQHLEDDQEVDFFAEHQVKDDLLLQVSLDTASEATWSREVRSLQAAADAYPHARPLLLTLDPTPPSRPLPTRLEWMPASRWLLGED